MKNIFHLLFILFGLQYVNGQTQVTQIVSSANDQGSFPTDFVVFEDKFFFEASTPEYGREIWVSTGIEDHLSLLRDVNPGNHSPGISSGFWIMYTFRLMTGSMEMNCGGQTGRWKEQNLLPMSFRGPQARIHLI